MDLYRELEDRHKCSGMCDHGLFYFGLDLDNGIAKNTCLIDFKEYVSGHIGGFSGASIFGGVISLFIFILHITMYNR